MVPNHKPDWGWPWSWSIWSDAMTNIPRQWQKSGTTRRWLHIGFIPHTLPSYAWTGSSYNMPCASIRRRSVTAWRIRIHSVFHAWSQEWPPLGSRYLSHLPLANTRKTTLDFV